MKKIIFEIMFLGALVVSLWNVSSAGASDVDILVRLLVKKGILSETEAEEVLAETKAIVEDEIRHVIHEEVEHANLGTAPKWTEKIALKGDLRLRYQAQRGQGMDSADHRDRGRFRFRIGVNADVTDQFKVKAGLTTGGDNPRSANQTFQDDFATPDIRMDYAYALYQPFDWMDIKGGKIQKTSWWHPSDLLWDGDINPEGGSLEMVWEGLSEDHGFDLFFNTGIFVLEEFSDGDEPIMYVFQPGVAWDLTEDVHLKTAGTYYGFEKQQGNAYHGAATSGTNSLTGGAPRFDYDSVAAGVELAFDDVFGLDWPRVAFLGEFVNSFDPDSRNIGWLAGLKVGDKKVKKQGDWQVYYNYRHLEQDAWPDIFPDSDFYGGSTDAKGHEIVAQYGLRDHVILGLDYYYSEPISDGIANPAFTSTFGEEHLLQADVLFHF